MTSIVLARVISLDKAISLIFKGISINVFARSAAFADVKAIANPVMVINQLTTPPPRFKNQERPSMRYLTTVIKGSKPIAKPITAFLRFVIMSVATLAFSAKSASTEANISASALFFSNSTALVPNNLAASLRS